MKTAKAHQVAAQALRDSIEDLRPEFLLALRERQIKLQAARDRLAKRPQDIMAANEIRSLAHSMRGTAASCLYPELSKIAGKLEDLMLAGAANFTAILTQTDAVLKHCRKIQRADA